VSRLTTVQLERKRAVLRASEAKVKELNWGGVPSMQTRATAFREAIQDAIKILTAKIEELKAESTKTRIGDGPDVSSHQGAIDWGKVKGAYSTAFIKATEGRTFTDERLGTNLKGARDAGISIGAYHFARPDNNSAPAEVNAFVERVESHGFKFISYADWKAGKPGVLGVLDFEHAPFSPAWAHAWGADFKRRTGVAAALYGYGSSLNPILNARTQFAFVWLAAYVSDWKPYYAGEDSDVHFWQYTDKGTCPGISGPCDLNRYLA